MRGWGERSEEGVSMSRVEGGSVSERGVYGGWREGQ